MRSYGTEDRNKDTRIPASHEASTPRSPFPLPLRPSAAADLFLTGDVLRVCGELEHTCPRCRMLRPLAPPTSAHSTVLSSALRIVVSVEWTRPGRARASSCGTAVKMSLLDRMPQVYEYITM